jgi:hypothetical protein
MEYNQDSIIYIESVINPDSYTNQKTLAKK